MVFRVFCMDGQFHKENRSRFTKMQFFSTFSLGELSMLLLNRSICHSKCLICLAASFVFSAAASSSNIGRPWRSYSPSLAFPVQHSASSSFVPRNKSGRDSSRHTTVAFASSSASSWLNFLARRIRCKFAGVKSGSRRSGCVHASTSSRWRMACFRVVAAALSSLEAGGAETWISSEKHKSMLAIRSISAVSRENESRRLILFGADREAIVEPGLGWFEVVQQRVYFHQLFAEVLSRKSFQNPLLLNFGKRFYRRRRD